MAKCATCVYHEKDKRMENVWFLANYNEAKNMHYPCIYPNTWKTQVAHLAIYGIKMWLKNYYWHLLEIFCRILCCIYLFSS